VSGGSEGKGCVRLQERKSIELNLICGTSVVLIVCALRWILAQAIQKQYHHNWIIDNLPAASILDHDEYISTQFVGYPIGTRAVFGPVFIVL
jgi:hypothetical protein